MFFRGFLGFLAGLIVVGLLVGLGAGAYQAGIAQGIVDAGRYPAGASVPIAGYGWHGPDLFGLLFGLFFLFILFGIIRAAFSRGRGWDRGWGHHGYGPGPGWGKSFGPGEGPESWRGDRDSRIADWHRRLHEADEGGSGAKPGTSSSGSAMS
jgi:hypothetical protein